MGYGVVPDLTTGKYMCLEPCQHTDCAAYRRDFIEDADCQICGEVIQAGDAFYYVDHGRTPKVHHACEMSGQPVPQPHGRPVQFGMMKDS